ncbi:hypothetical protein C6P42_002482 [Pichia californica]|nr:hypothetical protein C6P42_002482 [[Candida] californica]
MNICDLPQNVLQVIANHLELPFKIRLAMANKILFNYIIPTAYSIIVYEPVGYNNGSTVKLASRNDCISDNYTVLLSDNNIGKFLETISNFSILGFKYSDFIVELYLEKLTNIQVFDLCGWRNSNMLPNFTNLKKYQFPSTLSIHPLTYDHAPNLDTLIVDYNFCDYLDYNKGSIEFFNHQNIKKIFIKGTLGKNEDMVMFKLLTKFPLMIRNINQLHFLVDSDENYEFVYRRIVGFFAILRKMNLVMHNINKLSLVLTNVSSSTILSLISKHIIFENLISLSLLIQDDSKILTLVKSLDKLSTIVHHHGFNIKKLLIKYDLLNEDTEKNHLRSMMLLKLCESFSNLTHLNIDLKIEGLNFSNLLMILGTPISNNIDTLYDIRINVYHPSENMIGNILPTLEDAVLLFPYLNFLNNCDCSICQSILEKLSLKDSSNLNLFDETIKVSTLLIIGQELDLVQRQCSYSINSSSLINPNSKLLRLNTYSKNGYLFDHLISKQLNHSLTYLKNLKLFEICGLVYINKVYGSNVKKEQMHYYDNDNDYVDEEEDGQMLDCDNDELVNNSPNAPQFELLYGNKFTGLEANILTNITDLGRVFNGNMTSFGS